MGECQVSVIYGTFWARLLQANHTQVHDSYCSMSCMYVLTLAMLVEGSHRILDSRNMVLITGKAFTILGLVVKWMVRSEDTALHCDERRQRDGVSRRAIHQSEDI